MKGISDHTADPSNVPSLRDLLVANDLLFFSIWAFHTLGPLWILSSTELPPWGLKITLPPNNVILISPPPVLPLSLCQLLDLMGSFSSFHFKWISPLLILLFPGHHRPHCMYPSGVYVCVCTWIMLHFFCFGLCIFTDIEFIYTTL